MCLSNYTTHAHLFDDALNQAESRSVYNPTRLDSILGNTESEVEKGHAVMDEIRRILCVTDAQSFRSEAQVLSHSKMLCCVLVAVYGNLYYSNERKILAYNNIEKLEKGVLITAPRRNGKSDTIVRFVVACLLSIPKFKILIIAASKGQANKKTGLLAGISALLKDTFNIVSYDYSNDTTIQMHLNGTKRVVVAMSQDMGDR